MINKKNFDHGHFKVLINAYNELAEDRNLLKIAEYNRINLYALSNLRTTYFQDTIFYDMEWDEENIRLYKEHDKILHLYATIEKTIISQNIQFFLWLGDPGILDKDFILKLKSYCKVGFWTFDDPVNSEKILKHCAKYYDIGFTATVNYNQKLKMSAILKSWGCPESAFIPMGVFEGKYNKTENFKDRKYDLVFIGSVFQKRLLFMFKLKKHFGDRFLIFGKQWNGEGYPWHKKLLLKILKFYYKVPHIKAITNEELIYYYQNSKIGINTHMTDGGPSAVRTYELPANGVMQICDSENGLNNIYEIGKEVISYKNNNSKDAIQKIEYYLLHESERQKIAINGYNKTHKHYMIWHSFVQILKLVKTG